MNSRTPFAFGVSKAHFDTATGAPASGTAPLHEPEPETPDRRPALRHSISAFVAVSISACVSTLLALFLWPVPGQAADDTPKTDAGTSRYEYEYREPHDPNG